MEDVNPIDMRIPATRFRAPKALVLIASSFGGTIVLNEILPQFGNLDEIAMVIVQHINPDFSGSFAQRLNEKTDFEIKEAVDGERISAGKAFVAPGGVHMIFEKRKLGQYCLKTYEGSKINGVIPSADVLFSSAAQVVSLPIIAVILTGMGSDGADGVEQLQKRGAYIMTQSESTCSAYGMPKAVVERDMSDIVLDPEEIPPHVTKMKDMLRPMLPHPSDLIRINENQIDHYLK